MEYPLLGQIDSPKDLKKLSVGQLPMLCEEIHSFLIESVSKTGGHLSSNLGIIELTVALHHVFSTPEDKFVFDVGCILEMFACRNFLCLIHYLIY